MKKFIEQLCMDYDLHDIDTIVIKDGRIVEEVMVSNPNIKIPKLQRNDVYRIASISKLFVGIAIMQLVEKGLLSLDSNIEDYIDFPLRNPNHPDCVITLKHLLTHTSSIRDTDQYYVPYGEHSKELFTKEGKYYKDTIFSKRRPGDTFIYCNSGFHLLAMTIENISKLRFDIYIESNILKPLQMNGSFNATEDYTKKNLRPIHRKIDGVWTPQVDNTIQDISYDQYELGTNGSLFGPQGSMRSNANELSKLMLDLMKEESTLLSKKSKETMFQIHYLDPNKEIKNFRHFYRNSGIAFNVINNECVNKPIKNLSYTLIGHCGLAYGFHGIFFFDHEHKNGLIFNVTGEGKHMLDYSGTFSQFFAFQEDMFRYVDSKYFKN